MECPECGAPAVAFRVPGDLREFAPGGADAAAICTACLSIAPAEDAPGVEDVDEQSSSARQTESDDADFSRVIEAFPGGGAGAAMALAVGLLVESLALNRDAVAALFDRVQDAGADPWLVLERLAVAPTVDPDADLDRLRRQLDQLLR